MITLFPQELVLRVAAATVGAQEIGANRSAYVDRIIKQTGLNPPQPWCAAFVADVGRCALQEQWPVPMTASCLKLGEWAEGKGVLSTTPEIGAIFLVYHPKLKRFAHTGFLDELGRVEHDTIEGNTNDGDGSREGWRVSARKREFGERDRFIHWWKVL